VDDGPPLDLQEPGPANGRPQRWFSPGVGGVGLASFFSDSGHEIATAILPSFVTSTLHASAGALGLIEGISDALMGVTKLVAGPLADDPETRRRLASGGYLGTAVATGAIGLTVAAWQAGALRALAWISRGVRTPARDSILASLAPREAYGRAFGLERAGDNLGAVVGPLLAALLVAWLGIRPAIYFAAVPGLFAAVAITVAAREARRRGPTARSSGRRLDLRALRDAGLVRPMLPIAMFELGNVATTLLILRTTQLLAHDGRSLAAAASLAILVYAAHNAFAAIIAYLGGHWIDRAGPRLVFAAGGALYVLAYAGFAIPWPSWPPLLVAFILAGSGIGLAETAESALVARLLPDRLRGSGFGLLGGVQSVGDFASSAIVGLLYALVSPTVGFAYAGGWMLLSVVASGAASQRRSTAPP
jgi:MFS family permease